MTSRLTHKYTKCNALILCMCGRVRRPNRRQIGLICTQPSGEITNGEAEQNGGYLRLYMPRSQAQAGMVRVGARTLPGWGADRRKSILVAGGHRHPG
jgi:hypothetical protein